MMGKPFAWAVWMVASAAWAQSSTPAAISSKAAPTQPIPFNHKAHAAAGLTCLGCHAIAAPGDLAGLPAATFCMGCHETVKKDSPAIQSLKAFANDRKPIPWVRVYKLPGFVYFSHQVHYKKARIECAVCHGPVAERSMIAQEKSTAMVDCMKCHDQYKAPNGCELCHDSH
jgi:Cytochrome c7 and related cytochrome c/Class III cytochrome C family